jgi:predicted metal-dependent hydrolase
MAKVDSSIESIMYLPFKECSVPYYIRFSARARRLQMRMKEKKLEVIAPSGTPKQIIMAFIDKNRSWVKVQHLALQENLDLFWPKKFAPGEEISIFGEKKILDVRFSDGCLTYVCGQRLVVNIDANISISLLEDGIRAEVIEHLRKVAQAHVEDYTQKICSQLQRWPKSVRIRETRSRWGSCGIHQDIYINWLLILAPKLILMYVVVHECCHLFYRSHGIRFWQKVESIMPEYKKAEQWLRQYGSYLTVPK